MIGTYLMRAPDTGQAEFWLNSQPEALPAALLHIGTVGAALGLLHAILVVGLRLPAAFVTIVGGITIAAALLPQPLTHRLSLSSPVRIATLGPTLALLGVVTTLLAVFAVLAAHRRSEPEPPPTAPLPLRQLLAELCLGAWLALPLVLTFAQVLLAWGNPGLLLLLATVAGASATGVTWAWRPEHERVRRERLRQLSGLVPWSILLSVLIGLLVEWQAKPAAVLGHLALLLLVAPLAALVSLALAVSLWRCGLAGDAAGSVSRAPRAGRTDADHGSDVERRDCCGGRGLHRRAGHP